MQPLKQCYLFSSCKAKFFDALMATSRTDVYMANVREGGMYEYLMI
jgi:hypothetical protein